MRLTILWAISLFLLSCNNVPEFPREEIQFLNPQDKEIRYYMAPEKPGQPFTYTHSEEYSPEKIFPVCMTAKYKMELSDYAKNMEEWGKKHCK